MAALLALGALTTLAYGGLLRAWFHPVDDLVHLAGVLRGSYPSPHFRPAHFAWNSSLFAAFGRDAGGWHAASLALHLATALGLVGLARGAGASSLAALVGGSVALSLAAPHEAVTWISAACGELSVLFVVLAGVSWTRFLSARDCSRARGVGRRGTALWYAAALVAIVLGMLSKEDSVIALPLLLGLDVHRRGWRAACSPRALLVYAPFALLAAGYLQLAYDPELWASRPGVGRYGLAWDLVPRLLGNLVLLAWPQHLAGAGLPASTPVLGAVLVLLVPVAAIRWRSRAPRAARLLTLGLVLSAAGLLPVLPGPWPVVAATRYGYAALPGVALLSAGAFDLAAGSDRPLPRARAWLLGAAAAGFCLVHALAVRATIAWETVNASARFQDLVRATLEVAPGPGGSDVLLVAPPVWNPLDLELAPVVLGEGYDEQGRRVELPLDGLQGALGLWRASADVRAFRSGRWVPVLDGDLPVAEWRRAAESYSESREVPVGRLVVPASLFPVEER